ncbi:MAG TPA: zeta toxin family protein [Acidimicrobiia bacterium]|nr:zeta toxin family protein [Acidimicrobiia bacterium]
MESECHPGEDERGHDQLLAAIGSIKVDPSAPKTSWSESSMQGDIILVGEEHRRAADIIVDRLIDEIRASPRRFTMTVAGESGSGKSETGQALAESLGKRGVKAVVLQQDDYYVLPPQFNDAARRANFAWVGTTEVRLDLLDAHLQAAQAGDPTIVKPLVIYSENRIDEEEISYEGVQVVIAEGVYTSQCDNVDRRVFIDRNRLETIEHRMKRGREEFDPFIEKVLKQEHEIISRHRSRADVIITRDYDVEFVQE